MKKSITLFLVASVSMSFACSQEKTVELIITNPSPNSRTNEITEISTDAVAGLNGKKFIISDINGKQVPYQVTHDNKIIFPVTVKAKGNVIYTISPGTPDEVKIIAYGKQYPERIDDIAWENDRIAFRAYGPALQASGEKAFGYDVWVKRVPEPIVDLRYKAELNPATKAEINELKKTDKAAAQKLANSISYHIDHGNGLDFYKVGPTLGAGTSALLVNDSIVYPYCYKTFEILDNGPLRFTVRLIYNPLTIKSDTSVIETRIISLDAGSQMNKITLNFDNLSEPTPLVTGIVLHTQDNFHAYTANSYIAYGDTTDTMNGQIYIGAAFPKKPEKSFEVFFSEEEQLQRGATGHLLAYTTYIPGTNYTYYAGAGWNKWGFENTEDWYMYVNEFAQNIKEPLSVTIK